MSSAKRRLVIFMPPMLAFASCSSTEVFYTQDSKVGDLFCGVPSGFEPSPFFSNYLFGLGIRPFQDDFQHGYAPMTDEADSSVVLAEL